MTPPLLHDFYILKSIAYDNVNIQKIKKILYTTNSLTGIFKGSFKSLKLIRFLKTMIRVLISCGFISILHTNHSIEVLIIPLRACCQIVNGLYPNSFQVNDNTHINKNGLYPVWTSFSISQSNPAFCPLFL